MKKLLLFLGIAIFLTVGCGPGNMASKAAEVPQTSQVAECPTTATYAAFMAIATKIPQIRLFELNAEGRGLYITYMNKLRADEKLPPRQADRVIFGDFTQEGSQYIGIVLFYNNCVVQDTVATVILKDFEGFMDKAGVTDSMVIATKILDADGQSS